MCGTWLTLWLVQVLVTTLTYSSVSIYVIAIELSCKLWMKMKLIRFVIYATPVIPSTLLHREHEIIAHGRATYTDFRTNSEKGSLGCQSVHRLTLVSDKRMYNSWRENDIF